MNLPKIMYAGVVDGKIYVLPCDGDEYTPLGVALFQNEIDAKKHFDRVVRVDPSKLFKLDET